MSLCAFAQLLRTLFSSQLDISHVLNGTTPENQHRKCGPYLLEEIERGFGQIIYFKYYKHTNESCSFSVFGLIGMSGQN
jgi:hypothetical protein